MSARTPGAAKRRRRKQADASNGLVVYIHGMRDHSRVPPTPVPMPNSYQYPEFCDWTEESRLLVNVRIGAAGALVVLETDGRLVRQIPVTMPPAPMSVAAYRKYERR